MGEKRRRDEYEDERPAGRRRDRDRDGDEPEEPVKGGGIPVWVWVAGGSGIVSVLLVGLVIVIALAAAGTEDAAPVAQDAPLPAMNAPPAGRDTSPSIPPAQVEFVNLINDYAARYRPAANEIQKTELRFERATALKRFATNHPAATNWVGTLRKIRTDKDGTATVTISVGGSNVVSVRNLGGVYGIARGSSLYTALSEMTEGQAVVFSGEFCPLERFERDYLSEMSLTEEGSMTEPEFVMRFKVVQSPQKALEQVKEQKALDQEKERQERLEAERQRQERRLVKERQDELAREAARLESERLKQAEADRLKAQAEAKVKQELDAAEEKARAGRLEREEKAASGPLNLATKLLKEDDPYQNDNAVEARKLLAKIVKDWPDTKAAAEAKKLLPHEKSAKQAEKDKEHADSQVKYAKKLIDQGDPTTAKERLLKIVKEYGDTEAAGEARKLLKMLGK